VIRALAAHLSGESCPLAGARRRPARRCRATEARRGQTAGPPSVQDSSHASVFHTPPSVQDSSHASVSARWRAGRTTRAHAAGAVERMRHAARVTPRSHDASRSRASDGESCTHGGPERRVVLPRHRARGRPAGIGFAPAGAVVGSRRCPACECASAQNTPRASRRDRTISHARRRRAACRAPSAAPSGVSCTRGASERRVPPAGPPPRAGASGPSPAGTA